MFGFNPISSNGLAASPYFVYIKNLFVSSTASIVAFIRDLFRVLTIIVGNTTILWKGLFVLLTKVSNCGIILWKTVNRLFYVLSNTIPSLSTVVTSFVNFANNKVMYARSVVKEITSVKFRTLFITKDNKL